MITFSQAADLKNHIRTIHEGEKTEEESVTISALPDIKNPWLVENITDFIYFCCPECDIHVKTENLFKEHALEKHVLAKDFFMKNKVLNVTNENKLTEYTNSEQNYDQSETNIDFSALTSVHEEIKEVKV